jgi:hypothetical protein
MTETATTSFEIECDLIGTYDRGDASVGLGPGYEDIGVEGLFALRHSRDAAGKSRWARVDLLEGLDAAARLTLLDNVRRFIGDDVIVETLAEAA